MTKLSEGGVIHYMKRVIRHPLYFTMWIVSHDMSLIELEEPIVFNKRAQPIRLPTDEETLPVGKVANIQGWGLTEEDQQDWDHLKKTTLPIRAPEDCASAWWFFPKKVFIGPEAPNICTEWEDAVPNTCNGDSGSALTYNGVQYGIVSYGLGCVNPQYPKIFTHVYNLRDFIYENTNVQNN